MFESLIMKKGPYFLFTDKNICDSLHIIIADARIQNMDPRVLITSNTWLQLLLCIYIQNLKRRALDNQVLSL